MKNDNKLAVAVNGQNIYACNVNQKRIYLNLFSFIIELMVKPIAQ